MTALEEMQEYRQRKLDRILDHAANMDWYVDDENWDMADYHRKKADEIRAEVNAIEHCMKIVRSHEKPVENPNVIKEPYNAERWPLYDANRKCEHVIELQWSGYKCTKCPGWYCA